MDDGNGVPKGWIGWLGLVDANPAPVRLTKKALAEAVERRRGAALAEKDAHAIRSVVCRTRLDATVDEHFAAWGGGRGGDGVAVGGEASLKDAGQIRRVAEWLGKALTLNPVAVAFLNRQAFGTVIRPAMILPGGKVAVGAIASHNGVISSLPAFWSNAALEATTALAWAQAAFDRLGAEERLEAIDREIAALNDRRNRARTDAERMDIHRDLRRLADERRALMGAPLD